MSFTGNITSVAFNHTGENYVTGCDNGVITVWNTVTCTKIQEFIYHDSIANLSFNYNDQLIIGLKWNGHAVLFCNINTGTIQTYSLWGYIVNSIAISPIKNMLLIGCSDGILRSLNIDKLCETSVFPIIYNDLNAVTFSSNGLLYAFSTYDDIIRTVIICNATTNTILKKIYCSAYDIMFSYDNTQLITRTNTIIQIWNIFDSNMIKYECSYRIKHILSGKNDTIISIGDRNKIHIFNIKTEQIIRTIENHADIVNNIALSNDGKLIVSSGGCNVLVHRVNSGNHTKVALRESDDVMDGVIKK